ncbi:hypothetical protein [Celerinatantimonas sp. MCCC 1A17872]|uniref:hypothetical protein n=1 Tax=Celerinatantimonas sp. MCCC 1A17872 TaxID=3177514 RepID=UPI0038C2BEDF
MHNYDGIEYRYQSSNLDSKLSLERLEKILGFQPLTESLDFDLSSYSGGVGVDDKYAIACNVTSEQIGQFQQLNMIYSPIDAIAKQEWRDDFIWLLTGGEAYSDLLTSAAAFINQEKSAFQDICSTDGMIYFGYGSDVNHWSTIWGRSGRFNYLYNSQG